MFIAVKIDTNTAETFRHGIWYARGDVKQRLDIVPLTLASTGNILWQCLELVMLIRKNYEN